MAFGAGRSAAVALLILNVILYFIITAIAAWAVNHGIEKTHKTGTSLSLNPNSRAISVKQKT